MSYTPRLDSNGMSSSSTYYKYIYGTTYPTIPLPNCTFYAYSRTMEFSINDYGGYWSAITHDNNPYWFTGKSTYPMAKLWLQEAVNSGLWQTGSTPKLGAIAVFGRLDDSSNAGHVAVVEEINGDGSVNLSNSDYPSVVYPNGRYFYMANNQFLTVGSSGNYTTFPFLGYIYNPLSSGDTPTPPTPDDGMIIYRRGQWVKIISFGNANSLGTGRRAYGIGWKRQILRVYSKRKYPYQVGLIGKGPNGRDATTGFYTANALQKL